MEMLDVCKAKSKQSGSRCKNYAVKGRNVCHIHGGKTPKHNLGPKTLEGKKRQATSRWEHGLRSKEFIKEREGFREYVSNAMREIQGIMDMFV